MTTLHERKKQTTAPTAGNGSERRKHRRHDFEQHSIIVERWDGKRCVGQKLGEIVDISASGVRIRTNQQDIRPDNQIRVRLQLPNYAGISPFVDTQVQSPEPKNEWVGWMAVARVEKKGKEKIEVGAQLVDMDEMDRGMLGLYLSTQPLAA